MACLQFCDRCGKQIHGAIYLCKYNVRRPVLSTADEECWTEDIKLCKRCRDYILDKFFKDLVTMSISKETEQISLKEDI